MSLFKYNTVFICVILCGVFSSCISKGGDVKLVFGASYYYGDIPATKAYLQIGNGKKTLFPFALTNEIARKIPMEVKGNFEPEEVGKDTKPEFEIYYTRFGRKIAFFGVRKDDKLLIYRKEIEQTNEEVDNIDEYAFFELVAEYDVNGVDLSLRYSRDDNYYTANFEQSFFEPISYSKEEIRRFVITKYQEDFKGNEVNYFTKRFNDFQNDMGYYYEGELTPSQTSQIEAKYKLTYNLDEWEEIINYSFVCPYVDAGYLQSPKVSGKIIEERLKEKFYTGKLRITTIDTTTNEESYTCEKNIRLVQINGLLYFDYMQLLSD